MPASLNVKRGIAIKILPGRKIAVSTLVPSAPYWTEDIIGTATVPANKDVSFTFSVSDESEGIVLDVPIRWPKGYTMGTLRVLGVDDPFGVELPKEDLNTDATPHALKFSFKKNGDLVSSENDGQKVTILKTRGLKDIPNKYWLALMLPKRGVGELRLTGFQVAGRSNFSSEDLFG